MKKNKNFLIINLLILLFLISCKTEKPVYYANYIETTPAIDGKIDSVWELAEPAYLHHYWGELPEDSLDFHAYFKVMHNNEYLFILVDVIDDVKYTAPKPESKLDKHLWNLEDYDRVNLMFDSNNDGIIDFNNKDIGISMNYGIDSVFTFNICENDVLAKQKDTELGYTVEFKIPIKYFNAKRIAFQVLVTDNDKKFQEKDYEVYGRWESEFGWGVNRYMEDVNKRFGYLLIN